MKTLLAIALAVSFCYAEYALAADASAEKPTQEEVEAALEVLQDPIDENITFCAAAHETQDPEVVFECVENLYRRAAAILILSSHDNGYNKGKKECQESQAAPLPNAGKGTTRSREIFNF